VAVAIDVGVDARGDLILDVVAQGGRPEGGLELLGVSGDPQRFGRIGGV